MTSSPPRSFALPISVLLIVAFWGFATWAQVVRPGGAAVPGSVAALAGYVLLKAVFAVAVIRILLDANQESLSDLGLTRPALKAAIVWGPLLAAGIFVLVNVLLGSVLRALGTPAKPEALAALFRDPREAPLWIFAAVAGGGFSEELIRAFVLTRFERFLGRVGLVAALVLDTVVFAFGHLYQGVTGAIQSAVTGLLFALIFLRRRRVADSMVVHALFDVCGVAAAYFLYAGKR